MHLFGRFGALAGDQVAEAGVPLGSNRPIEARHRASGRAHLLDVLERELRLLRDLLVGRVASERGHQPALRTGDLLLALDDVNGNANRP